MFGDDIHDMYDGGVVFDGIAGYGSTHDGDGFFLLVCDECLDKTKEIHKINKYKNDTV